MLTVDSYGSGHREPEAPDEYETVELGPIRQGLLAWQRWRRTRPFWGGLLIILGGAEILLSEQAPLPIVIHVGAQGLAGYLVPIVLVLCGVLLWLTPAQQTFYSVLAVVLALGSWVTSNLGGFFVGLLLGVIGGALAFAWQRGEEPEQAFREEPGEPENKPSAGLGLVLADEAPDDPADDDTHADGESRPQEHREPLPQEDAEPLARAEGGESGGSLRAGGVLMGIFALPLMLMVLPERAADHRRQQSARCAIRTDWLP